MTSSPAHVISAGALVHDAGRLLLVRHVVPGRYDFWVPPGGRVEGDESLEAAALRECLEETGIVAAAPRLAYVEEFHCPESRHVKFWFACTMAGGTLDHRHPGNCIEHIAEVDWCSLAQMATRTLMPPFLQARYRQDLAAGFPQPVRMPLRAMAFW
ncbi:MAG: NUDIX hydrolase [Xanthomonadales bacterium]|nr:NUDIX hydrolase [Xanthomonadales bacterium]